MMEKQPPDANPIDQASIPLNQGCHPTAMIGRIRFDGLPPILWTLR
jgi:hypothetical protein